MKNIIVILEQECEPKIALAKAIDIASIYHAQLHVIACCSYEESWLNAVVGMKPMRGIKEQVLSHTEKWVSEYVADHTNGIKPTYEVIWTQDFVDSIINEAKIRQSDLIVKTGRRSETMFHTPSDFQLLRDSPVPVYMVNHPTPSTSNTIMISLDLLSDSEKKQALNKRLLALGCEVAKRRGFEVKCCYSVDIPVVLKDLDLINADQYIEERTRLAISKGEALLAEFELMPDALIVDAGTPSRTINKLAKKYDARWVMIGSVSNKGVKAALIGNKSEQLLSSSQHDLIVVPPED